MKIRPSIFLFVGVIILLTVMVFWLGKKKPDPKVAPIATGSDTNATSLQATRAVENEHPSIPSSNQNWVTSSNVVSAVTIQADNAKEGLTGLNDVPIIFYGRLEDQFGNPVSGAQIAASARIYNGTQSGVDRFAVTSDANGYFRINHGKGESLGLMPSKDGYALAATNTEFKYSFMYQDHFSPDPNNSTIIKMWKLQGAEPLFGIDQHYKLNYPNAPLNFDLLTGKIVPSGGDIRLTVKRPVGVVSQRNPQNWGIQIEAMDGGLIETPVEYSRIVYSAPEVGYQPNLTIAEITNNHWSDCLNRFFFVESRTKQIYSKVELSFCINDVPDGLLYISFRGVANTNGSRNWEVAPK